MTLTAFREDGSLNVIVESPRGATLKFKVRSHARSDRADAVVAVGVVYRHDWGFVPQTRAADGDPVDVMIVAIENRLRPLSPNRRGARAVLPWAATFFEKKNVRMLG